MLTIEFERLGLAPGSKVLDLGCGAGRHIRGTRRMAGVGAVALDIQAKEVASTRDSLKGMDTLAPEAGGTVPDAGPWLVLQGDSYRLPFRSDSFDCVIASEILEHMHDDSAVLREISRVLKTGGIFAISVPRTGPEAVCWALSRDYHEAAGGHVRIYRRSALRDKLTNHGYRVFASHFAHALHSPFWWLKCVVGVENEQASIVRLYHQFLVWDLMKQPWLTRLLDWVLNPFIGKSVVFYAVKG